MLNYIVAEENRTLTENGAATYASSNSACLDFFATMGALRDASETEILARFQSAYAENADMALKLLFFARDVRGGLGERRLFRVILRWLALHEPQSVRKNLAYIPEYGRYDDWLPLLGTPCEREAVQRIDEQLTQDLEAGAEVSLLAKWLPSVNASNPETVRSAKRLAQLLGLRQSQYRQLLSLLRGKIHILENDLRVCDYNFDYAKQPSKALFKYRSAFERHDAERYRDFLTQAERGDTVLHTGTLTPYDVIAPCFCRSEPLTAAERRTMDVTWNALENYATDENALVIADGSGSMYSGQPLPIAVALSLAIYFAERNHGVFHDYFITFSQNPQLVQIKGADIYEKVCCCAGYCEIVNTDLQAVFELLLRAAVRNAVPQEDLPKKLYIVSDMEFDCCIDRADETNFERAKRRFAEYGYRLPEVVFWNVASHRRQQPVTRNEAGVALVSGVTPRLFEMLAGGLVSPYASMLEVIQSERYAAILA